MMKQVVCILAILLVWSAAGAPPAETTLKALEEKWSEAQVKGDLGALDALLADGFVATDVEARLHTKAEMLRDIKSGDLKILSARVDDMRVMVYGEAAVVIGRWKGKGVEKGKPFDDTERWTDTWVRQKGAWRCVASQSTLVEE